MLSFFFWNVLLLVLDADGTNEDGEASFYLPMFETMLASEAITRQHPALSSDLNSELNFTEDLTAESFGVASLSDWYARRHLLYINSLSSIGL